MLRAGSRFVGGSLARTVARQQQIVFLASRRAVTSSLSCQAPQVASNRWYSSATNSAQTAPSTDTATTTATNTSSATGKKEKEHVVVLGSGWAGYEAAWKLDKSLYDVTLVSPANHKVFTPMLPGSATGYMDFQSISNPVRNLKGVQYQQAKARSVDFNNRAITCRDIFKKHDFEVLYDKLIIAVGCKTNTFNTPGVAENEGHFVYFLKHLHHARQIKNRVIECFERADIPDVSEEEKRRLLSFVVVGGGPTSCEFTAELHDFVRKDIARLYPDLIPHFSLHVVRRQCNHK